MLPVHGNVAYAIGEPKTLNMCKLYLGIITFIQGMSENPNAKGAFCLWVFGVSKVRLIQTIHLRPHFQTGLLLHCICIRSLFS